MVLTKFKRNSIMKTGIPLSEMTTSVADHKKNRQIFIPADQVANIQLLTEILEELKAIRQELKVKV